MHPGRSYARLADMQFRSVLMYPCSTRMLHTASVVFHQLPFGDRPLSRLQVNKALTKRDRSMRVSSLIKGLTSFEELAEKYNEVNNRLSIQERQRAAEMEAAEAGLPLRMFMQQIYPSLFCWLFFFLRIASVGVNVADMY